MPEIPLREFAFPLRTLDSNDRDISDLAPLQSLVGNARVVSLGESAHGVREFYQLKDRLMRYLISELGFTAFVMESGFAEGWAVNDWILGGDGSLERLADTGITYRFGECEEMRGQLQWLRNWNATHEHKVQFYGMDVPGSGTNPGPGVAACLARIPAQPADAELLERSNLGEEQMEAVARYIALDTSQREYLSQAITAVVERAKATGDEIAYRCALSAQCLDRIMIDNWQDAPGQYTRDALMADNVRWILEREQRIVIWAHNAHIQRGTFRSMPMLGTFLKPVLGDQMVIIGTTYASGKVIQTHNSGKTLNEMTVSMEELQPPPPDTIDALMDSVDLPHHIVDLRHLPSTQLREHLAMRINHDTVEIAPDAFDALAHIRHVTPVPGAFESESEDLARSRAG